MVCYCFMVYNILKKEEREKNSIAWLLLWSFSFWMELCVGLKYEFLANLLLLQLEIQLFEQGSLLNLDVQSLVI